MTIEQPSDPAGAARLPLLKKLFGRSLNRNIPPRIQAEIDRQDQSSEVLIKIIQLVIVAVWAVLYAIAPKTSGGTAFAPVPWALATYFVLNLGALFWALRRRIPDWVVFASIIIDVAILMLLIWSFHIQYGQPPSFYLKAPTLMYVFIFIALRALRFEPRFIVFAGITAASGWLALVAYAVWSAHGMMTTRDYVKYLTGNEILLGAEFDKTITMLMVTGIIALALVRANDLLVRATAEAQAARDLSRFFDRDIATNIRNADEVAIPGSGKRIEAAILNVDLRGFTTYTANVDPQAALRLLIAYQGRVVGIIQRNGGSIDKFMGDGIMATFGAVRPTGTFAADALRAVEEILADAGTWKSDPVLHPFAADKVNAAVVTGPIVFGTIGDETRLEYTVIGAAANLSAKLEKHNKQLGTRALADAATYKLAIAQGYADQPRRRAKQSGLPGISRIVVLG